jgi:hypothetical protein
LTWNIHTLSTIMGVIASKEVPIILDSGSSLSLLNPASLSGQILTTELDIPIKIECISCATLQITKRTSLNIVIGNRE